MANSTSARADWRPASVSFVLTSALAAFMLFLGVRGFFDPVGAAQGFGLPLTDGGDAVWLQIKAGRDLCAGLGLVAFLAIRQRRMMAIFLLANVLIPLNDMGVSLSSPVHETGYAVAVHGGAAALMVFLAASLMVGAGARAADASRADREPEPVAGSR